MKQLITLISSAVLLCPLWTEAATPAMVDDMTWTGNLAVPQISTSANYYYVSQSVSPAATCSAITNISLSIQLPSNSSAIIPVHGLYSCPASDNSGQIYPQPLIGTMVAMSSQNAVASSSAPTNFYNLVVYLAGPSGITCQIYPSANMSMSCTLFSYGGGPGSWAAVSGNSNFTYKPSN